MTFQTTDRVSDGRISEIERDVGPAVENSEVIYMAREIRQQRERLRSAPGASGKPVPHVATVTDNNQPGWTFIAETAPHVTLPVGTKLYTEAALIAVGAGVAEDIWQREAATATEPPTADELTEYAYAAGIVKRGDAVPFQMLDVLRRQVAAAWSLRRAPEPSELHAAASDLQQLLSKLIDAGEIEITATDIGAEALCARLNALKEALS